MLGCPQAIFMDVRGCAIVTASYWTLTLTDVALRMLVLMHFHQVQAGAADGLRLSWKAGRNGTRRECAWRASVGDHACWEDTSWLVR